MSRRQKLVMFWSKREQDFLIRFPRSADGHLVQHVFNSDRQRADYGSDPALPLACRMAWDLSFVDELERRGYDTKTLRFSVERRTDDERRTHGENEGCEEKHGAVDDGAEDPAFARATERGDA